MQKLKTLGTIPDSIMLWTAGTDFDVNICDWCCDLDVLVSYIWKGLFNIFFMYLEFLIELLVQNALLTCMGPYFFILVFIFKKFNAKMRVWTCIQCNNYVNAWYHMIFSPEG